MPTLPVSQLPTSAHLVPSAPASIPEGEPQGAVLPPSAEALLPELEPSLYVSTRGFKGEPQLPETGERVIDQPNEDTLRDDDYFLIDHDGRGTRKIASERVKTVYGIPRVQQVSLILGATEDYGFIDLTDPGAIQATVWIPNHYTGRPYSVSQEVVFGPTRKLRIALSKGMAPGGTVDVVLSGT
jgi:hypothetical protein